MTKIQWTTKLAAAVAVLVFGAIGCASSSSKSPAEPMTSPQASSQTRSSETGSATPGGVKTSRSVSLTDPVYFDTDRSDLRHDARKALRASAEKIEQHPEWGTLTIEGHCDERGSEEYNLALGERRAAKVRKYLKDLGVDGKRLETVSYGESKPAAQGHDESSWKLNRRSEIEAGIRHAVNR